MPTDARKSRPAVQLKAKSEPAPPAAGRLRGPNRPESRSLFTVKGSPAFGAWLADLAVSLRLSQAVVVDQALAEYARNHGLPDPPSR